MHLRCLARSRALLAVFYLFCSVAAEPKPAPLRGRWHEVPEGVLLPFPWRDFAGAEPALPIRVRGARGATARMVYRTDHSRKQSLLLSGGMQPMRSVGAKTDFSVETSFLHFQSRERSRIPQGSRKLCFRLSGEQNLPAQHPPTRMPRRPYPFVLLRTQPPALWAMSLT